MKKISIENLVFIILSLGLAAYTTIRVFNASITHDEVGNYLGYSIYSVKDILLFTNLQLGNHVLNSLAVKLTVWIFGVNEFALRLPNLLAHLFFLYFSWKIITQLTQDKFLAIGGFILVNFNPYLLDFFSISRGYGLEICMMAISIYFLLRFWQRGKPVHIWAAMVMSALGVLSNLTFIPVYVSMVLLINFLVMLDSVRMKKSFKPFMAALLRVNLPILVISAGLAAIVVGPIIKLEAIGEFSARANKEGFWDNMFRSVIRHSMYKQFRPAHPLEFNLTVVFQVLSAMLVVVMGWDLYKERWNATRNSYFLMFSLLMIVCLWFYTQHIFLGSRYPQQRTALFILPLFLFTLIACLEIIISMKVLIYPVRILMGAAMIFILIHFFNSANFKSYFDWPHNQDSKQLLKENLDMMKSSVPDGGRRVAFGIYWMNKVPIDFYLLAWKEKEVRTIEYRDKFGEKADYYYIPIAFRDSIQKFNPVLIKEYPDTKTALYKSSDQEGIK